MAFIFQTKETITIQSLSEKWNYSICFDGKYFLFIYWCLVCMVEVYENVFIVNEKQAQ